MHAIHRVYIYDSHKSGRDTQRKTGEETRGVLESHIWVQILASFTASVILGSFSESYL